MRLSIRCSALSGQSTHRLGRASAVAVAVAAAVGVGLSVPPGAGAADLSATPATLQAVFAAAQGGDTIHLAAGDYGTFTGGAKSAPVTLAGAGAALEVNLNGAQNLRFDGLTVKGATVTASRNITFANSAFTGMSVVRANSAGANILFDHDTFDGISPCGTCFEGRITVNGTDQPSGAAGVIISNSHFSGGSADGVQLVGGANGVQIGPGNEFTGMSQSGPVHTDPIQLYGADNTVITGNYVHDDATGIMAPDGTDGAVTITNNVFTRIEQQGIYLGHKPGVILEHNTVADGVIINDDPGKSGPKTSGAVIKNNVITGGLALQNLSSGAITQEDYNLIQGGSGSHDIKAGAQFTGGASPTTMAGFALAPGSRGTKAADDGTDMGAFGFMVGSGPAAPAPAPPAPPAPAKPVSGGGTKAGGPPKLTLRQPTAGSRHSGRLRFAAKASDDHGIRRVEFRIDGKSVATDKTAPYNRTTRRWGSLRRGSHTATARAVSRDGQVTTRSVTVLRAKKKSPHSSKVRRAWTVQSTPGDGSTVLAGSGVAGRRVAVRLARCASRTGKTVVRRVLTASASGELAATVATPGLCVAKVVAQ